MPPRTPAPESLPEAAQVPEAEQTTLLEKREESGGQLRLAGIVFDTYWIFETDDRLLLVDQHAAHERILFDRLMARFEGGHISQRLLSPQIVRLTAHDLALATELIPVFNEAGFEIEPFDDTCVAVHAIPTLFGRNEPPRELFLEALDGWQAGRGQVTRERMRGQIAQMACKHAIKGGDKLSAVEVEGFLREMLKSEAMPKMCIRDRFNTCCVRDNAERRALGNVTWLKELKKEKPNLLIGVCGCMVQQPQICLLYTSRCV